jgi:uncharacterized protein YcbX
MTPVVSMILRHPIKSIGREELAHVELSANTWLPFDRQWAVAHERSKLDGAWAKKVNFLRGVSGPSLMAVTSKLDEATGILTLTHPKRPKIDLRPDRSEDTARLIDWLRPIWPDDLPRPTSVYRAEGVQLTDVPDPWISINSMASLKALSHQAGQTLSPHRFRGNLWLDGLAPWQEFDWVGKTIQVGTATLAIRQQITRCKATMANPETGQRDMDTLGALDELGHQQFGVYAQVIEGGNVTVGDIVQP